MPLCCGVGEGVNPPHQLGSSAQTNLYVCGTFRRVVVFGSTALSNALDNYEPILAKYDSAGNPAWFVKLETSGFNGTTTIPDVALDSEGAVHVVGSFGAGVGNFGGILLSAELSNSDLFHVEFSPSGTAI